MILAGCNPGVFIEPLEVSQSEFHFSMLGGRAEIQVSHDDWILEKVTCNHIDEWGWITENGHEYYSAITLKGPGSAFHESNFGSFTIERFPDNRIVIDLGQSFLPEETLVELYVINDYSEIVITVTQDECTGYRFDRIEYGDVTYVSSVNKVEKGWSLNFNNEGDSVLEQDFPAFTEDAVRTVYFPAGAVQSNSLYLEFYDTLMKYVSEPFSVPVPAPRMGAEGLVFDGDMAPFDYKGSTFPIELPDERVSCSFEPGWSVLDMYWYVEEYHVDYTLWLCHDGGGAPIFLTGTLQSKSYTGEWEKILKKI